MSPRQNRARAQFLTWLQNNHPELFDAVVARASTANMAIIAQELSGLGVHGGAEGVLTSVKDSGDAWWQKIAGGLTAAGTVYLSLKNQRDAMELNLERAKQGLPPVDAGVTAPVIRTEIDLPPDVVKQLTAGAGQQVNKLLLFGGAAIIAIMLFMRN